MANRLLLVNGNSNGCDALVEATLRAGFETHVAHSRLDAIALLDTSRFDIFVVEARFTAAGLIPEIHTIDPDLAIVMLVVPEDQPLLEQGFADGIHDFIEMPFSEFDLQQRLVYARAYSELRNGVETQKNKLEARIASQARRISNLLTSSLRSLTAALEAKDPYTRNHSARVAELSRLIAGAIRPRDYAFMDSVETAALLHDIGKIGVSELVLGKAEKLTDEEFEEIKKHPVIGEAILAPLLYDPEILGAVRHHHERMDGRGYPDKLVGDQIPLMARIVSVADAFDALTSARPYRKGLPHFQARRILLEGAGTQWDPELVHHLLRLAPDASQLEILAA